MAVLSTAFGSLAACRYTLIACHPLHRHGQRIASLPDGLKFVRPSPKPQFPSLLASFSSSRPSAQYHDAELSDGAEPASSRKPTSMGFAESGFKRPEVIEWNKDIANNVTLTGILGRSVEIKYLDTGKVVANSSLKVSRATVRGDAEDMWFFLEFWDELAEIAVAHLKKLDHIYVSGSVYVVTYTGKDNLEKTLVKVTVNDLKYVHMNNPSYHEVSFAAKIPVSSNKEEQWQDYFKNPTEWWDNRSNKISLTAPDFRNKTTGYPLWIDSGSTPLWVKEQLLTADSNNSFQEGHEPVSGQTSVAEKIARVEKLWQDFSMNPSKWWDCRSKKTNPRYPDFKNKTTGEGLWLDSSLCPPWVKSQLALSDSKAQIMRKEL